MQLPSGARSRAHARAARLLSAEGAEPEQVAAQLLLCEPAAEPDAVAALRGAAAAALRRGTPETAVSYLRRALAEPPVGSARAAVLGELGGAERIARDPAAEAHLEQARRASTDPIARARLAAQLADVLFYAGDLARCAEVLRVGLNDLGDRDPDLAVRLHTLTTTVEGNFGWPTPAPEVALKRLRELAARGLPASRCARLVLAHLLAVRGDSCHQVAALVEQGLDDGRFLVEETCEALPTALAVWALICIDDLDRADVLIEAMLVDAQTRGSVVGFVAATGRRGAVALRRGALAEAEADARAAFTLAKEHDLTLGIPLQAAFFGLTLLERGELDEAAAVVEGVTQDPTTMTPYLPTLLQARGRIRLAHAQRVPAIADLRRCGQLAEDVQQHNPNWLAWRSTLALALAGEHPREARELAQTELELARHTGSARAIGIALRAQGLLTDAGHRIELLEQSVAVLEPTPARLELAYSLTELGAALRRAGARVTARQPLRRALDLAHHYGATPLAERAHEEALATGARPRRPQTTGVHALTPSELRVARLAAQSLTNRDIAQTLFITTKTVSDHLSNAYRKLNISSRNQLATAMTKTSNSPPERH